jgi:hydrogenase large subunit
VPENNTDSTNNLSPAVGDTVTSYPKANAYSWLKAPRYAGAAYETGPLARMWVNGDYTAGISVLDRHRARAREALKVAQAMQSWLGQISGTTVYQQPTLPASGQAMGLTEAPRGALGHWVQYSGGKISRYQIITPTCWNASPADTVGKRGPMEQALLGTPVKDPAQPIEVLRVIHSFDPCLDCAVHVIRPKEDVKIFSVSHVHTDGTNHTHEHSR